MMSARGLISYSVAIAALVSMGLAIGWLLGRPEAHTAMRPTYARSRARSHANLDESARRVALLDTGTSVIPNSDKPRPRFTDVSQLHGIDFTYFRGETGEYWLPETMGGGVAWTDFDGDGRPDLLFVQGRQLPDDSSDRFAAVLFRNMGAGRWEPLPRAVGPSNSGYGMGATVGDVDNDGFEDIYFTNFGADALFQNNGDGTFREVTSSTGLGRSMWGTSAAFADLDQDGDIDLYVATYVYNDPAVRCEDPYTHKPKYCGPDYYEAQDDVLYENSGAGRFHDVCHTAGIDRLDGKGLGVVIADLIDDDGRPEIFVANDLRPNFLFRILEPRRSGNGLPDAAAASSMQFEEVAMRLGVAVNGEGIREANMGVACADFDEDGRLDLYVTHYFMEHDTLWLNLGQDGFCDRTKTAGLNLPTLQQLSWGTNAIDYDCDGRLDLFVTSGHINKNDGGTVPYAMKPQLFRNDGSAGQLRFTEVSAQAGNYFERPHVGRGSAVADYDRDGAMDIAVMHHHEPAALLHNETTPRGHAVGFRLLGTRSNRSAIGARITIQIAARGEPPRELVREIVGGGSYLSSDSRDIVIGLGPAERVTHVKLRWPSQELSQFEDLSAGGYYSIREGESTVRFEPFEEQTHDH